MVVVHGDGQWFQLDIEMVEGFITDEEDKKACSENYGTYEEALLLACHISKKYNLEDDIFVVQWRAAVGDRGTKIGLYD
jgi:hypothetical protein